jgi:hypothetical protein
MGKIALSQNTSLDGVMQSPGPADVPFKYRSWAVDFDGSREGARFNYEEEVRGHLRGHAGVLAHSGR